MKTIIRNTKLWIMMIAGTLIAACNDPSAHLPEKPEMEVFSSQDLLFAREGGSMSVSFQTNRPWTAQVINSPDWISFSPDKGNAGNHEIVITVSEQPEGANYREAVLVINSSAAGKDIHVMQSGKPIVVTFEATGVSETTATLNGSWIYSGKDLSVTEYGFALKYGNNDFVKTAVETIDENTGAFILDLAELQPETEYTYHSYVVTSEDEEICGSDIMFKTPAIPVAKTIAEFKAYTRKSVTKGKTSVLNENFIVEGVVLSSYVPAEDRPAKAVFPAAEAYIQITDANTADSGLTLYFKAATDNTFNAGDKVKIRMKDATLQHSSAGAVSAYPVVSQIEVTGSGNVLEPITIAHTSLADYEAMPVKIEKSQLIKVHTTDGTELWKDSDLWTLEVENSDVTYQMYIPAASELASQNKQTGSGYVSGIVITDGKEMAVEAYAASLEGERFVSLLEPRFTELNFDLENLIVGVENELELSLRYENGGSKEINGSDIKITSNVEFTAEIEDTYTLKKAGGSIKIMVKLTPADYTPVIFTVSGFLEGEQSGELEVKDPVVVDKGNFEATWTVVGKNSESAGSSNNPAVSVSSLVLTGEQTNYKDANAATKFDGNNTTAPSTYFETAVTVNSGTLALYGFSYMERGTSGTQVSIQYSIANANFVEIANYTMEDGGERSFDFADINALKSIGAGTNVKFRIVPIGATSKDKYGLTDAAPISLWGNVK